MGMRLWHSTGQAYYRPILSFSMLHAESYITVQHTILINRKAGNGPGDEAILS